MTCTWHRFEELSSWVAVCSYGYRALAIILTSSSSSNFRNPVLSGHVLGRSQHLALLHFLLASAQQTVHELQKQVAELQQRNSYLPQVNDEQEALIQSWSRAAEPCSTRLHISNAAA